MDTTVRNMDEEAYRALKAHAAMRGKSIGEAITEAIWAYVGGSQVDEKTPSFWEIGPFDFGPGSEHLSEEIDDVVYGDGGD